ncbi:protein of unknown function (DUF928) [Rivularia sp. PCC 7116]|uniref:DUF928 domain-containing protein n=1 Tax=Rivularia sp. PCC 7116 TaxID=373994 RepID=UPI00029F2A2F|nr:DUF928 domain-containing protein [Rivularia sp. PCC 7116]AFY58624.1 protein of unknown function (DUF928) [Rivularia sp. PCC 7116]
MTWIKKKLYLAAIPLSIGISIAAAVSVRANAPNVFAATPKNRTLISQSFTPPNREGKSPVTAGAATRGGCDTKQNLVTPLMPKEKLGLTFDERPTFYWHTSKSNAETAEFLLLDDNDDLVYEANVNLPKKPGIFAFTLPPEAPGLKTNKQYHWYLSVNCSSEETDDIVTVEGWVERTKPNLATWIKLNKSTPKYRSKIYADASIWHEAITNVAQQRCIAPYDSTMVLYWNQLLTSVGLKELVSESITNVCEVKNDDNK